MIENYLEKKKKAKEFYKLNKLGKSLSLDLFPIKGTHNIQATDEYYKFNEKMD